MLEGIVCQALLPRADGKGRVASLEILVPTPAIRNLIRDDKVHQIYGGDADRPGEARDADGEPVAGQPLHEAADHARDGVGGLVDTRTNCRK